MRICQVKNTKYNKKIHYKYNTISIYYKDYTISIYYKDYTISIYYKNYTNSIYTNSKYYKYNTIRIYYKYTNRSLARFYLKTFKITKICAYSHIGGVGGGVAHARPCAEIYLYFCRHTFDRHSVLTTGRKSESTAPIHYTVVTSMIYLMNTRQS